MWLKSPKPIDNLVIQSILQDPTYNTILEIFSVIKKYFRLGELLHCVDLCLRSVWNTDSAESDILYCSSENNKNTRLSYASIFSVTGAVIL